MKALTRRLLSAFRAVSYTTKREPSADNPASFVIGPVDREKETSEPARPQTAPVSPSLQKQFRFFFDLGYTTGVVDGYKKGVEDGNHLGEARGYEEAIKDVIFVLETAGSITPDALRKLGEKSESHEAVN